MVLSLLASWASSRRQVEESYDGHLAAARERLVPEQLAAAPATAAVDSALAGLIEQERGVRRLEAEVESHRRNVGVTRRRVLDFVKGRLDSRYYDDRLGLLHQIQQDLESLTDTLMSLAGHDSATFPRGEPRVILMIDDLDRCPPPRVVEVLEAAQLLVKTRLFVVVLAMDVRYITRALEKSYAGVLSRDGDPSGLDYIEKIVQIPYRIRPIQRTAMEPYLSLLMGLESAPGEVGGESRPRPTPELEDAPAEEPPEEEAAVEEDGADGGGTEASDTDSRRPAVKTSQAPASGASETGGDDSGLRELERKARILKFSRTELRRLRDACTAVSMSPRAAKRLVNICKLFKLIWDERYPRDQGPSPGVQQATLILLALAARYPVVMREVLYDLEEVARRGSSTDGCQAYLEQRWQGVPHPPRHAGHWQEVLGILNGDAFPESLRFATAGGKAGGDRFTEDDIRLVSSFSFVGEADGQ